MCPSFTEPISEENLERWNLEKNAPNPGVSVSSQRREGCWSKTTEQDRGLVNVSQDNKTITFGILFCARQKLFAFL